MGIDAKLFSEQWVRAWNAHDVEAVLEHFDDEVVFTSPIAAQLLPSSEGRVVGKRALSDYWIRALRNHPELHFTVEAVYAGIDTIVINYRNQRGDLANEVLHFANGLVIEGHGTYLTGT
jgi:hypothetical protein